MDISTGGASRVTARGAWVTATAYAKNDIVGNLGDSFICILGHTSGAASEPGVGGSTATYWVKYAEGMTSAQLSALTTMSTGARGDIFYIDASGVPAKLNAGTANTVLMTGGTTGNPSWGATTATVTPGTFSAGTYTFPATSQVNIVGGGTTTGLTVKAASDGATLGSELVNNGDMDTPADFTIGEGWHIKHIKFSTQPTVVAGGANYAVGDILSVTGGGGTGGVVRVATVSGTAVATVEVISPGSGYATTNPTATTKITGAGDDNCTLSITVGTTETVALHTPKSISTVAVNNASTGYSVDDYLTVDGSGTDGVVKVTSIGGSGEVTGVSVIAGGSGYDALETLTTLTAAPATSNPINNTCYDSADNVIWVYPNNYTNVLYRYDVAAGTWSTLTPSPNITQGRVGGLLVYDQLNNRLLFFCGADGSNNRYNQVWAYTKGSPGSWAQLTPGGVTATTRQALCGVYVHHATDPYVIVTGGYTGSSVTTGTQKYNITANTWEDLTACTYSHYYSSAVYDSTNNAMFVILGGYSTTAFRPYIQRYDIAAGTWSSVSVSVNASNASAFFNPKNSLIYIYGGATGANANSAGWNKSWKYDHSTTTLTETTHSTNWTTGYSNGMVLVESTGLAYIVGGYDGASSTTAAYSTVINKSYATVNGTGAGTGCTIWVTGHRRAALQQDLSTAAAVSKGSALAAGDVFSVGYTLTRSAGSCIVEMGGAQSNALSAATTATYQCYLSTDALALLKVIPSSDFDGTIDNVSVKLVTAAVPNVKLLTSGSAESSLHQPTPYSDAIGYNSSSRLYNTGSIYSTAIGYAANEYVLANSASVKVGARAGRYLAASNSTCIGYLAGQGYSPSRSTGASNCFFGYFTGASIGSGTLNVGVGTNSFGGYSPTEASIVTGSYNTAVGSSSLYMPGSGSYNCAYGYQSMGQTATNVTGSSNTCIGKQAGYSLTSASNCIYIGPGAGYSNTSTSQQFVVSYSNTVPFLSGTMDASSTTGTLALRGAFTPSASATYDLGGSSYKWNYAYTTYLGATGTRLTNAYFTNCTSTNALTVDSDETLKKDITPIALGMDFISELKPVSYKWVNRDYTEIEMVPDEETGEEKPVEVTKSTTHDRVHYGIVAQDLKKTMDSMGLTPETFAAYCADPETGKLGIRYAELMAPLIKAVQELNDRLKALEK